MNTETARKIDALMAGMGSYFSRHISLLEAKENGTPFTMTWEGAACEAFDNGRLPNACGTTPAAWSELTR